MRLVVVTGVGTGVGKTHLSAALATAWGKREPVLAYKPIESGVLGDLGTDQALLRDVSTFHVKPPPLQLCFRQAVSPHLAARLEGRCIVLDDIAREVARLRSLSPVILELPGGLFSPLTSGSLNADLVSLFAPDATLLAAPDRLGVLHDCLAVTRACTALSLALSCIVMTPPESPDLSTGTNASELRAFSAAPLITSIGRAPIPELADDPGILGLLRLCLPRL